LNKSRDNQEALSAKRKLLFTVVLVLVPTTILFLAAEVYIRFTSPFTELWALTGREAGRNPIEQTALVDAFSAFKGRPGSYGDSGKTINQHGFISTPELSIEKPENTIRVVFLGGSSTAGTGFNLPDEDTWPWKVADIIGRDLNGKKLEFINAALSGYTTFESFGRLWSRVRFFSPDIVVVYHGWNEMYYFNEGLKIASWRTLPDGSWGFHQVSGQSFIEPYWFDHMIRYSQLLTKVRVGAIDQPEGESGVAKELKESYDSDGLEVYRTNLQLIREATSIIGAKLFVAKQATLIVPDSPKTDRIRNRYNLHGFDHDAHVDAFNQIYRIIDEEIEVEDIIDVTQLSGVSEYFYDHIHPTELGAAEIAAVVARPLQSYLGDSAER
jgi:lysophospholipase L1-like esterase